MKSEGENWFKKHADTMLILGTVVTATFWITSKDAELKLTQAIKAGNLQGYYQLACLFSLLEQPDKSLSFLMKTESFQALPPIDELLEDDWLENLRSSSSFRDFLHFLERKSRQHEEL